MLLRGSVRALVATPLAVLCGVLLTGVAAADPRVEAAANVALKKAESDYLAMNYGSAAARIDKALKACGTKKCSAAVRATLLRDLATMQFRKGQKDQAARTWADALQLQANLSLNPAYDTPELRQAFGGASKGSGTPAKGETATVEQPAGDFTHTPPGEQKVDTPLPIYVEGGGAEVKRVVVKYKPAGMTTWKRIDLKKVAQGWGGLIPCADVQAGTMRYYIQGLDESKETVASNGDARHAFTVEIKADISGEAPHLPGMKAPTSCQEGADCPPDFPGCNKSGESADESGKGGEVTDETGWSKATSSTPFRRVWLGLMGAMDFETIPSGHDLCALVLPGQPNQAMPANSAHMYCTNPDGTDFPVYPRTDPRALAQDTSLVPGQAGRSGGGVQRGDTRLTLTFDYALTGNLLLGARLGLTFLKYPGQAAYADGNAWNLANGRLYADARGTWVFGADALARTFAPMIFAGVGLASFDAHTDSTATLQPPQNAPAVTGKVSIWQMNGPFFLMLGGGARFTVRQIAITVAARANGTFGVNGFIPTFGPEVGLAYGF
jgi:hypothetical protein